MHSDGQKRLRVKHFSFGYIRMYECAETRTNGNHRKLLSLPYKCTYSILMVAKKVIESGNRFFALCLVEDILL